MANHTASIVVHAPARDVYQRWTRFHDFPRFMSNVCSVSYLDRERTRWVVNVIGRHEWVACNENWIPDRQIGWRSIEGLQNSGLVEFSSKPNGDTEVNIVIEYRPPAGLLGRVAEMLGSGKSLERHVRRDLERLAQEIEKKPKRVDTLAQDARDTSTLAEAISSAEPFEEEP